MDSRLQLSSPSSVPFWIHGEQVATKDTFDVVGPINSKPVWRSSTASLADVDKIVASFAAALPSWAETPMSERRSIVFKAAEVFVRRKSELQAYTKAETGQSDEMQQLELSMVSSSLADLAVLSSSIAGYTPPADADGETSMVLKVPWGVVLVIVPWNGPYGIGVREIVPALLMGNTVILKGSETCPATFWALASVFIEAGLPAGCLNTVMHRSQDAGTITAALVAHPAVRKISFTGSSGTGATIAALAGKHLKPCIMKLGDTAPAIICGDADIEDAAFKVAIGAFFYGGQMCMATRRAIIHRAVAGHFKQALITFIDAAVGSDPQQVVSKEAVARNVALVRDAVSKGAQIVCGSIPDEGSAASSSWMKPIVLEGASKDMEVCHTASFGPCLCLQVVDTDEQAIEMANNMQYGLVASVFSRDLRRAMRIGKALNMGDIHINGSTVSYDNAMPMGGAKKSSFGRAMGREGSEEWVRTVTLKWDDKERAPSLNETIVKWKDSECSKSFLISAAHVTTCHLHSSKPSF